MEIKRKILVSLFDQTELYLKEIGEFSPFGVIADVENSITNLGYYSDEEIVNSLVAIENLEEDIKRKITKSNYVLGAIAVDVSIKIKEEPKDALLVKITNDGINWTEDYYPYNLQGNNIVWS